MIRRTVLEWGKLEYGEDPDNVQTIPIRAADRIAAVAAASSLAGEGGQGVIEHGRKALRARGMVGVVATGDCVLEILPKIDCLPVTDKSQEGSVRIRLVHMLMEALDIKIDVGQMTALGQGSNLLEILVRVFSEKLLAAVHQGMPRRYIAHEEDLSALRGRLDVVRQFTVLAASPSRLACRFDALSSDIVLNQIMKAAVARLQRMTKSVANQRRLSELAFAYADVSDIAVSDLRWSDVVLDRTNVRWKELLNIAQLLLGNRFQTSSVGDSSGYSLLFPMNELFETYVSRILRRSLAGRGLRVVSQGGLVYCLTHRNAGGLFQTKPDILIKKGGQVLQVIDTKWKRISSDIEDKKLGVSQQDVYQMMAYGSLYGCERLTLLYPHHFGLARSEGQQTFHRVTNTDRILETCTIDVSHSVGISERLRQVVERPVAAGQATPTC
ncbi:McrC family protein [Achromobacter sp. Root565]|uniref:McrC family protein n=1 Tax=Achromobacter sp. Root565 TaxID=1736564 RepID=UPI0006FCF759|nr:restriction endonuclease [Achromobacter sp. Root565]KQZ98358.1 restriction endonuclease [Achromobacter sp. Root565]